MSFDLSSYVAVSLLSLRVGLAAVFIAHAWPKVTRPAWVVGDDAQPGLLHVFRVIGICEIAGAVAIAVGFLTQWAALGLAIMMVLAIPLNILKIRAPFASHAPKIGGWDLPLALLVGVLVVLVIGPGRYALDAFH